MLKTLYIHGLNSSPNRDKLKLIKQFSDVEALHINYIETPHTFDLLSDCITKLKINHIIGSSFGGFLGFWLAEKYGLPCLLFNPALAVKSLEMKLEKYTNRCPKRIVVLGSKDDTVDPILTNKFLQRHPSSLCVQRIIECNNLEHRIPVEVFKEFTYYFYNEWSCK